MTTKGATTEQKEFFQKVSVGAIHGGLYAQMDGNLVKTLLVIASFQNDKGECFPSQEKIAELCGVKRETVNKQIKKLVEFRTKEGHAVIEKTTVRQGREMTRTTYQILPASGVFFGKNKVVTFSSRGIEEGGHCEDSSEGCDESVTKVVTNRPEGCDQDVTLIITNNNNQVIRTKEQEKERAASFVELKKESSSKTNNENDSKIVELPKESKEAKRITSSIVAIGRNKEDGGTRAEAASQAAEQPTEGDSLSKESKPQERAATASKSESLSERDSILAIIEVNRIAKAAAAIKAREERRKQAKEELKAWGFDRTSETESEGNRTQEQPKPNTGQRDPLDDLSIDDILAMTEEQAAAMNG